MYRVSTKLSVPLCTSSIILLEPLPTPIINTLPDLEEDPSFLGM